MKRIRESNINTEEHFNEVFETDKELYSSYKNIQIYNNLFKLDLFEVGNFLDYGCGNAGALNQICDTKKIKGTGVDISSLIIKRNKTKYPKLNFYSVEEFQKSDTKSDTIVTTHTLEHTENPLKIAENLLSRTAKLFIIVPYKESWNKCPEHLWEFTSDSFDSLNPTITILGIINEAGYREVIYFWDKNNTKNYKYKKLFYQIKILPYHKIKGILKTIFDL